MKYEYILVYWSSDNQAKKRLNKSCLGTKRIKSNSENKAILLRDKHLKKMDSNKFRWCLDKINNQEVV